jgi:anti-sigma factor RsiW
MTHEQYEEWLFAYYDERAIQLSEERLTAGQEAELHAHLKTCEDCRMLAAAWQAVDTQLREAPLSAPQPGFAQRWEARLQDDRQQVQRRQTVAVLGFSAFGVVALLVALIMLTIPLIQTPKALVWAGVYRLITLISYLQLAQDTILPFVQAATGAVPAFWWLLIAGLLTQLGVLWVVSYRVLMNPWRITQ